MVFDSAVLNQLEYMERLLDRIDGVGGDAGAGPSLQDCQTGFLSQWLDGAGQAYGHLPEYRLLRQSHEDFLHCVSWVLQDLNWEPSPSRRLVLRHAIQDASAATISGLWDLKAKVHEVGAHQECPAMAP